MRRLSATGYAEIFHKKLCGDCLQDVLGNIDLHKY